MSYRFIFKVRCGRNGFADDEEYKSDWYENFEKCYNAYLLFNPTKNFKFLRHIQEEIIQYKKNNITHDNECRDGMIFYNDATELLKKLGITEKEFDKVIEIIEHSQKNKIDI